MTGCPEPDSGTKDVPPEDKPVADRWGKWVADDATATLDYSVAADGVCTITIGGTAQDYWSRWKGTAIYNYTAKANAIYTYKFEAWTESGNRELHVQYYYDGDEGVDLGESVSITGTRTTYTINGRKIPKDGIRGVSFQCADILGKFYVKMLEVKDVSFNLQWGATLTTYSDVEDIIKTQGWKVQSSGATFALATGATAETVYNWCLSNVTFVDNGTTSGSFESLVNFSSGGISAPSGLKTALNNNKANVPLAGIFNGGEVAVLFYITKN